MKAKKDYAELDIKEEINKKINSVNRTRHNRLKLSERLKKYYQRWKVAFFILNLEAVILIIRSLEAGNENSLFTLITAFFSVYVILLQYFVSEQNYNERSLRAHYHQLELEDLVLKLKRLIIKINQGSNMEHSESIDIYKEIMNDYQMMIKNNENHSKKDDDLRGGTHLSFVKRIDYSIENIFLFSNFIIGIMMVIFIINSL